MIHSMTKAVTDNQGQSLWSLALVILQLQTFYLLGAEQILPLPEVSPQSSEMKRKIIKLIEKNRQEVL